jgi:hypothetical protein
MSAETVEKFEWKVCNAGSIKEFLEELPTTHAGWELFAVVPIVYAGGGVSTDTGFILRREKK